MGVRRFRYGGNGGHGERMRVRGRCGRVEGRDIYRMRVIRYGIGRLIQVVEPTNLQLSIATCGGRRRWYRRANSMTVASCCRCDCSGRIYGVSVTSRCSYRHYRSYRMRVGSGGVRQYSTHGVIMHGQIG